jgi:hypothetical protein
MSDRVDPELIEARRHFYARASKSILLRAERA